MAVNYESHAISTWEGNQSGETLVINKPTGLAVGDLMVAQLSAVGDTGDPNGGWGDPGSWTLLTHEKDTGTSPKIRMDVFLKVADAGDVAASNFTFTHQTNDVGWTNGAITRVSGAVLANIIYDGDLVRGDSTPSYSLTLDQLYPECLLLFLITAVDNAASGSIASYAIATNNPSWTEAYDSYASSDGFGGSGYGDGLMGMAYAKRTAIGATGNASATLTNFQGSVAVMLIIPPVVSVNGNHPILAMTSDLLGGTISVGTTGTHSLLAMSSEIFSTSAQIERNGRWVDQEMNSKTWEDQVNAGY